MPENLKKWKLDPVGIAAKGKGGPVVVLRAAYEIANAMCSSDTAATNDVVGIEAPKNIQPHAPEIFSGFLERVKDGASLTETQWREAAEVAAREVGRSMRAHRDDKFGLENHVVYAIRWLVVLEAAAKGAPEAVRGMFREQMEAALQDVEKRTAAERAKKITANSALRILARMNELEAETRERVWKLVKRFRLSASRGGAPLYQWRGIASLLQSVSELVRTGLDTADVFRDAHEALAAWLYAAQSSRGQRDTKRKIVAMERFFRILHEVMTETHRPEKAAGDLQKAIREMLDGDGYNPISEAAMRALVAAADCSPQCKALIPHAAAVFADAGVFMTMHAWPDSVHFWILAVRHGDDELRKQIANAIQKKDAWIVEGNYPYDPYGYDYAHVSAPAAALLTYIAAPDARSDDAFVLARVAVDIPFPQKERWSRAEKEIEQDVMRAIQEWNREQAWEVLRRIAIMENSPQEEKDHVIAIILSDFPAAPALTVLHPRLAVSMDRVANPRRAPKLDADTAASMRTLGRFAQHVLQESQDDERHCQFSNLARLMIRTIQYAPDDLAYDTAREAVLALRRLACGDDPVLMPEGENLLVACIQRAGADAVRAMFSAPLDTDGEEYTDRLYATASLLLHGSLDPLKTDLNRTELLDTDACASLEKAGVRLRLRNQQDLAKNVNHLHSVPLHIPGVDDDDPNWRFNPLWNVNDRNALSALLKALRRRHHQHRRAVPWSRWTEIAALLHQSISTSGYNKGSAAMAMPAVLDEGRSIFQVSKELVDAWGWRLPEMLHGALPPQARILFCPAIRAYTKSCSLALKTLGHLGVHLIDSEFQALARAAMPSSDSAHMVVEAAYDLLCVLAAISDIARIRNANIRNAILNENERARRLRQVIDLIRAWSREDDERKFTACLPHMSLLVLLGTSGLPKQTGLSIAHDMAQVEAECSDGGHLHIAETLLLLI